MLTHIEENMFAVYSELLWIKNLNYRKLNNIQKAKQARRTRVQDCDRLWLERSTILCAHVTNRSATLYVERLEGVVEIPLRLAVTMPVLRLLLPFFVLNFVSVRAYELTCGPLSASPSSCQTRAPVSSNLGKVCQHLALIVDKYTKGEPMSLTLELETVLRMDCPAPEPHVDEDDYFLLGLCGQFNWCT